MLIRIPLTIPTVFTPQPTPTLYNLLRLTTPRPARGLA